MPLLKICRLLLTVQTKFQPPSLAYKDHAGHDLASGAHRHLSPSPSLLWSHSVILFPVKDPFLPQPSASNTVPRGLPMIHVLTPDFTADAFPVHPG